jgi:hypothetical protein
MLVIAAAHRPGRLLAPHKLLDPDCPEPPPRYLQFPAAPRIQLICSCGVHRPLPGIEAKLPGTEYPQANARLSRAPCGFASVPGLVGLDCPPASSAVVNATGSRTARIRPNRQHAVRPDLRRTLRSG